MTRAAERPPLTAPADVLAEKVALAISEAFASGKPGCWDAEARAAIAVVLAEVERHLSAVQYDPAPYTAMVARFRGLGG